MFTQTFNEVPLQRGLCIAGVHVSSIFSGSSKTQVGKSACYGRVPREQLYWDLETRREPGLFLSWGGSAALTTSHFGMPTRMRHKPQKHQGERGIQVIFFFPLLKVKFIYLTADGTKLSQVWFPSYCTGTAFSLWVGGRWLHRLYCLMALSPELFYCQVQICGTESTTFKRK